MDVFIDTNILLKFFHFSKDELDSLSDVFGSHEHGSAKVHLTQQVCDEFKRNREVKIKDALKRFNEVKFSAQLPCFMKEYEEFSEIKKLSNALQQKSKSILKKVYADISDQKLLADHLIGEIIKRSELLETTQEIYEQASMRMNIGNPPGKNSSIGDAINWTILLQSVPNDEDLHIISEDGDFYSDFNENAVNPFLAEEWKNKKNSNVYVYRTLSIFMKEHFDGVAFSFDKNKDNLIEDLRYARSFAATHDLIADLESYPYFSLNETQRILDAAKKNGQFGMIITDMDIYEFLNRIAVPRISEMTNQDHIQIIKDILEHQKEIMESNA